MDKPSLSVRGVALLEVPPDLARFTVSVSSRHVDRQTALEVLAAREAEVRRILDDAGEVVARRESGGLHLWPEPADGDAPAYTGSVTTTVTVSDFAVLSDLMVRLAVLDQCHVAGPLWELRPDSGHAAEARRAAVRDGLDRARQFAASLGAELDTLVMLTDCDPGADPEPAAAALAAEHGDSASFDVELRPLTVRAAVEMHLTITTPDLRS
jgi:uncharacterized protein YggE